MRIGILSRGQTLYSTKRLITVARSRGHEALVIDTLRAAVQLSGGGGLAWRRPVLPHVAAIIPRIGASITLYGLTVVRQFEAAGVVTTATAQAIAWSRDKLHSLQLMGRAGLPVPRTMVIADPQDVAPAIQAVGGLPVIVKPIRGTQGRGVALAAEAVSVVAMMSGVRPHQEQLLVQEYIAEAAGADIRAIVVGGRVVAAMERRAAPGNFRANLHQGATAQSVTLDGHSAALAVRAAQAMGLAVAGVDLIASGRGLLLLEVNSSPGLEGIERSSGVDVAGEIVAYLEGAVARRRRKRRRR